MIKEIVGLAFLVSVITATQANSHHLCAVDPPSTYDKELVIADENFRETTEKDNETSPMILAGTKVCQ